MSAQWTCTFCTLLNNQPSTKCNACGGEQTKTVCANCKDTFEEMKRNYEKQIDRLKEENKKFRSYLRKGNSSFTSPVVDVAQYSSSDNDQDEDKNEEKDIELVIDNGECTPSNINDSKKQNTNVCRRFAYNGSCQFGKSCRYSHDIQHNRNSTDQSIASRPSHAMPPSTFECVICMETKGIGNAHQLNCGHTFCRNCLKQHAIHYAKPEMPDCPIPKCNTKMQQNGDLQILLSPKEFLALDDRINKAAMSKLGKMQPCLTPNCSFQCEWLSGQRFDCLICNNSWCVDCQVPWHKGLYCEDYQKQQKEKERNERMKTNERKSDDDYREWRARMRRNVKKCPKCKNDVEKNGGCNHITCRCGTHWCWVHGCVVDGNDLAAHFTADHPVHNA